MRKQQHQLMYMYLPFVMQDPTSEVVWLSNLAALKQTVPAAAPTRTPAAAAGEIPETTDAAAAASAAAVDPSAGAAAGQGGRSVQSFDLRSFPRDSPRPPQLRLAAAVVPQTPSTAAAAAGEAAAQTSVAVYVDPTAARGCEAKTLAPATAAATAPLTSSRIQRLQQGPAMCLRVQAVGDVCLVSLPPFVGNNPYTVSVSAATMTICSIRTAALAEATAAAAAQWLLQQRGRRDFRLLHARWCCFLCTFRAGWGRGENGEDPAGGSSSSETAGPAAADTSHPESPHAKSQPRQSLRETEVLHATVNCCCRSCFCCWNLKCCAL